MGAALSIPDPEPGCGALQPVHPRPVVVAQDPKKDAPKEEPEKTYPRGYKAPSEEVLKKAHLEARLRHGKRMASLPVAAPATFDCRALGWVIPTQDQGNCGSCWDVAVTVQVSCAYVKAGLAKNDGSFVISPQY